MTLRPEQLRSLAAHGNLAYASARAQQSGAISRSALLAERIVDGSVFFPLVLDGVDAVACLVRVGPTADGRDDRIDGVFAAAEREVITSALDAAWGLLDGPGSRPRVEVAVPLIAEAGLPSPTGDSLWLAVALEAIRAFAEVPLLHRVLATGSPLSDLGGWAAKHACSEAVRAGLAHEGLLWMSRSAPLGAAQVQGHARVQDLEDACFTVFGYVPWHPRARDVRRIIVDALDRPAMNVREGVSRFDFEGADVRFVDPRSTRRTITVADLEPYATAVIEAMKGCDRIELAIAGPHPLAAFLGRRIWSPRRTVLLLHPGERTPGEQVWWSCTPRRGAAKSSARVVPSTDRLFLGRSPERCPAGWTFVDIGPTVRRSELPAIVGRVEALAAHDRPVWLLVDGPILVSGVLAEQLSNRLQLRFCHHRPGSDPSFENWHIES